MIEKGILNEEKLQAIVSAHASNWPHWTAYLARYVVDEDRSHHDWIACE